jgi:hypothetical protein
MPAAQLRGKKRKGIMRRSFIATFCAELRRKRVRRQPSFSLRALREKLRREKSAGKMERREEI